MPYEFKIFNIEFIPYMHIAKQRNVFKEQE